MRWARRSAAVCLVLVAAALAAQPSDAIASLYVEAAIEAYGEAAYERASRLVSVALEFSPASSDALYFDALLASRARERTDDSIDKAMNALDAGSWRLFSALHARVLLAAVLNRIYEHQRALDALDQVRRTPEASGDLLADFYFEQARAYEALGMISERDDTVALARGRFPDDPRFFAFLLRSEPYPDYEYRAELERLLDVSDDGDPRVLDLVYEYGRRAPVRSEVVWAVDTLDEYDWDDPALAVLEAELDPDVAVGVFLANGGFRDFGVFDAMRDALDDTARQTLYEQARLYSGESLLDYDRDGLWNERVTVASGLVVRWERDADQDGLVELDISFGSRAPQRVALRSDEREIILVYDRYPFAAAAERPFSARTERFELRPSAVRVEVVTDLPAEGPLFGSDLRPRPVVRNVARAELEAAATRIDTMTGDGIVVERIVREGGPVEEVQRDENGDGVWDHLVIVVAGEATAGVRDLDGDGYFEVAEGYRDGRLVALAVDDDDDGIPEVFEALEGEPVREWDLNEDGEIDVREFAWWTETVMREFPLADQRR